MTARKLSADYNFQSQRLQRNKRNIFGAIAQLGERFVRNEEVGGSIPLSSTKKRNHRFRFLFLNASFLKPSDEGYITFRNDFLFDETSTIVVTKMRTIPNGIAYDEILIFRSNSIADVLPERMYGLQ